jgi:hypothetical protein
MTILSLRNAILYMQKIKNIFGSVHPYHHHLSKHSILKNQNSATAGKAQNPLLLLTINYGQWF